MGCQNATTRVKQDGCLQRVRFTGRTPYLPTAIKTYKNGLAVTFPGPLGVSLIGTAWREKGLWSLETVDIRAFSTDTRGFLDDTPAGGGPGAVLKADVVARAVDSLPGPKRPLLYMSARGRPPGGLRRVTARSGHMRSQRAGNIM